MTRDQHERGSGVYELTVAGDLGAVLRWAVRPHGATQAETCTVLHAVVSDGHDLADLLRALHEHDVTVRDAFLIDSLPDR